MKRFFLLLTAAFLVVALMFRGGKWDKYYKNKIYQPPRELIQKVVSGFERPGTAIDLGCGIGNEAVFLLKNGWQVFAIDDQPKAIQMLKKRRDIDHFDHLVTATAKFDKGLDWGALPAADLVCASYALPFCNPQSFHDVWDQLKNKIVPGGKFAGHFFGTHYKGFSELEKLRMTFLNREEIEKLFQDFDIEYISEYELDGKSGTGRNTHPHIFEIIAKKRT